MMGVSCWLEESQDFKEAVTFGLGFEKWGEFGLVRMRVAMRQRGQSRQKESTGEICYGVVVKGCSFF